MNYLKFIVLGISLLLLVSCNDTKNDENNDKIKYKVPVEISKVETGSLSAFYTTTSTIKPEKEASIVAKTTGYINTILVEEGDVVKKGQLLAKLENEREVIELESSKINLEKAKSEYDRAKQSFDKDYLSKENFEQVEYNYKIAQNRMASARLSKNNTEIYSTINGVITQRDIQKGNMVVSGAKAFQIVNFKSLFIDIYVPEKQLSFLKKNQAVNLIVNATKSKRFSGYVKRISPVIDPNTGTSKIHIKINSNKELKPGMFTNLKIVYDTHKNTNIIPKSAILEEDNLNSVFLVKDSIVYKTEIETGFSNSLLTEIINGIELGDTIVSVGIGTLKDSTKVEIIKKQL